MIKNYLNQTAVWYNKIGMSGYGKPTYAEEGVTIKCRMEEQRSLLKTNLGSNVSGKEIFSKDSLLFCLEDVQEEDKIVLNGKEYIVQKVFDACRLDGSFSHREVTL